MTVASPELHVGRFAIENITEWCVSSVARTAQHGKVAVDFLREKHSVAVVGKECILKLVESFEVGCPCHSNRWAMITVAPCNVIAVFDEAYAWVVTIHPLPNFFIVALKTKRLFINIPVHSVFREAYVKHHATVGVIATEHSCEAFAERNDCAIEDAVACRKQVARDDRVL